MPKASLADPVVKRILSAGDEHAVSAIDWLDGKQARTSLRRRAWWCVVGGWLMVTVATAVSALVAWNFSQNAGDIFADKIPFVAVVLSPVLMGLTCVLLVGGVTAFFNDSFPGLSMTNSAIDWAGTGDAVSRLLSVGCTYPEAFRTAAEVTRTRSNRLWLTNAAKKVEQGATHLQDQSDTDGDPAIVELLVQSEESDPSVSWRIVADHFIEVARSRLALLLSTGPVLSTLLAGLIIWLSISATLGSMWRHALQTIQGLS
ncbi:hypothetical protein [Planctomycetes bacterium K23_9]